MNLRCSQNLTEKFFTADIIIKWFRFDSFHPVLWNQTATNNIKLLNSHWQQTLIPDSRGSASSSYEPACVSSACVSVTSRCSGEVCVRAKSERGKTLWSCWVEGTSNGGFLPPTAMRLTLRGRLDSMRSFFSLIILLDHRGSQRMKKRSWINLWNDQGHISPIICECNYCGLQSIESCWILISRAPQR